MTKEDLNTHRINYLIWRYLQESNYQETAAKLQKEWDVENPQSLEFAPHVKQQALVAVLHRGLLYGEIERNSIQARRGNATPLPGLFGPLAPLSPPPGVDGDEYENVRKREVDQHPLQVQQNGSPAKRPRLSNGHENGFEATPMDLDEMPNGNGHAYPSPKEVEPTPPPVFTDGPEKGTQVEKVAELGSKTTYLTLSDPENPDIKPLALFCSWSPRDPTVLAGAGTDRLARLWTISRGSANENYDHVNTSATPYLDLVDRTPITKNSDSSPTITAMSWTSDGAAIALASEWEDEYTTSERSSARVSIWGADGSLIQEFPGFEPPILCLQWNPPNTALLAIVPDGSSSLITIFQPSTQRTITLPLTEHHSEMQPIEAVWTSEQEFVICGGDLLSLFSVSDGAILRTRKFETREDHRLSKETYDRHSQLLATASEDGIIDIWDHTGQCHSMTAHQGQITALQWQPVPSHQELDSSAERLLASSGEDGIVSIWSTRSESKPKCSMTLDGPVVALAFTPDGAFLASATSNQILIWKIEDVSVPRARWTLDTEHHWRDGTSNGSSTEEEHGSLSWDANGQKLAYGLSSNIAVIEWKPLTNGIAH